MTTQAYFENIPQEIIKQLDTAEESIFVAVAFLSESSILNHLLGMANKNVTVEIMFDSTNDNTPKPNYRKILEDNGAKVYPIQEVQKKDFYKPGKMHHKFCVIDDRILITGSYNWSYSGQGNSENIVVVVDNVELCKRFKNEFLEIKDQYLKNKAWKESPEFKKIIEDAKAQKIHRVELAQRKAAKKEKDAEAKAKSNQPQ